MGHDGDGRADIQAWSTQPPVWGEGSKWSTNESHWMLFLDVEKDGPKPFWVTELQGGNNLYSATRPMNPTREDIAQWTWTAIGSGADRVIYRLLNARGQGGEAAEWSMLDFP